MKIWRVLPGALAVLMVAAPVMARAQAVDEAAAKNAAQARAVLDEMVQALGGDLWLNIRNQELIGKFAAFFHGNPNLGTTTYFDYHAWPDSDRIEFTKHRDVVQFFVGRQGWEVTYRGKKALPKDQVDEFLRRRDHSIETAVKVWMKDPKTILMYDGKQLAERHLADQVTLISAQNEAITILTDSQTHLPLQCSFQWRDPVYKDKNTEIVEYDDYHTIDGFPTPFSLSLVKNGETVRQYYITGAKYNQDLPADFWDVDATARRIKGK
ncbi:MAG: hypothetical protein ACLGRW_02430 [Acidobacteriota bacterium]|jgi:hypothetical protein